MADKTWTGAVNGDWSNAGNWSPSAPQNGDRIVFNSSSTGTLTTNNDVSLAYCFVYMNNPPGNVSISGNDLNLRSSSSYDVELDYGMADDRSLAINSNVYIYNNGSTIRTSRVSSGKLVIAGNITAHAEVLEYVWVGTNQNKTQFTFSGNNATAPMFGIYDSTLLPTTVNSYPTAGFAASSYRPGKVLTSSVQVSDVPLRMYASSELTFSGVNAASVSELSVLGSAVKITCAAPTTFNCDYTGSYSPYIYASNTLTLNGNHSGTIVRNTVSSGSYTFTSTSTSLKGLQMGFSSNGTLVIDWEGSVETFASGYGTLELYHDISFTSGTYLDWSSGKLRAKDDVTLTGPLVLRSGITLSASAGKTFTVDISSIAGGNSNVIGEGGYTGSVIINSIASTGSSFFVSSNGTFEIKSASSPGTSLYLDTGSTTTISGNASLNTIAMTSGAATFNLMNNAVVTCAGGLGLRGTGCLNGRGTINGSVTLAAASSILADSGQTISLTGSRTGNYLLTHSGAGTLSLGGSSTSNAGVTVSAGGLLLGHNSAVGTGTLTMASGTTLGSTANISIGTVAFSGTNALAFTSDYNLTIGTLNLGSAGKTITTTGSGVLALSALTGDYAVSKNGAGTLQVNTSHSKQFTCSAGVLKLGADLPTELIDASRPVVSSGGEINLNGHPSGVLIKPAQVGSKLSNGSATQSSIDLTVDMENMSPANLYVEGTGNLLLSSIATANVPVTRQINILKSGTGKFTSYGCYLGPTIPSAVTVSGGEFSLECVDEGTQADFSSISEVDVSAGATLSLSKVLPLSLPTLGVTSTSLVDLKRAQLDLDELTATAGSTLVVQASETGASTFGLPHAENISGVSSLDLSGATMASLEAGLNSASGTAYLFDSISLGDETTFDLHGKKLTLSSLSTNSTSAMRSENAASDPYQLVLDLASDLTLTSFFTDDTATPFIPLEKDGIGTLTLSGENHLSKLLVSGGSVKGNIEVDDLSIGSGCHLRPGSSPGITICVNFVMAPASFLDIELADSVPSSGPVAGTHFSQVVCDTATLGAGCLANFIYDPSFYCQDDVVFDFLSCPSVTGMLTIGTETDKPRYRGRSSIHLDSGGYFLSAFPYAYFSRLYRVAGSGESTPVGVMTLPSDPDSPVEGGYVVGMANAGYFVGISKYGNDLLKVTTETQVFRLATLDSVGFGIVPGGIGFNDVVVGRDGRVYFCTDMAIGTYWNGTVSVLAGSPTEVGNVAGCQGRQARFTSLSGLAVNTDGTLYACDSFTNSIYKITPDGMVYRFAGGSNPGASGYANGTGVQAKFDRPSSLGAMNDGRIIVADLGNGRVRIVSGDGHVLTLCGNGTESHVDGMGPAASFLSPSSILVPTNEAEIAYVMDADDETNTTYISLIRTNGQATTTYTLSGYYSDFVGINGSGVYVLKFST